MNLNTHYHTIPQYKKWLKMIRKEIMKKQHVIDTSKILITCNKNYTPENESPLL
jgi:hypothetical protein